MKYMLLTYIQESDWDPGERDACAAEAWKKCEELATSGRFVDASPLKSVDIATSLRVRDGKRQITDGPFAETTEQLGGYFLVEMDNLDEVIEFAASLPMAEKATIEIRPLDSIPGAESTPTKEGLSFSRLVDVSPDFLYRAWTEPELLKQWFCPSPWKVVEADLDPKSGGRFNTVMEGPNGERMESFGVYLEVTPGKKVAFTDAFREGWIPNGDPFFAAQVSFDNEGVRTRYSARADHWTDEAEAKHKAMGFEPGWNTALDQLIELAESQQSNLEK
jgi:uncharacterized protein YndB with AHSA1/START domain